MKRSAQQRGFGAIVAIVVLVVLAALAAAIVRLGSTASATSTQSLLAARALQAARAGTEWGAYLALKGSWTNCSGASQTLDLTASTGFRVTVTYTSASFNDGESAPGTVNTVRIYTLDAVACSSTACPDNRAAITPNYVERHWQVQLAK